MTNQLTPQQLLEIARMVTPKEKWILCPDGRIVADETCKVFQPHKPTERGQAQLMKVVFAVSGRIAGDGLQEYALMQALAEGNINAILSLAHEVLCN